MDATAIAKKVSGALVMMSLLSLVTRVRLIWA
jgi:hypothetical protein